jgi:hypothetical protein
MKITAKKIRPYIKIMLILVFGSAVVFTFLFLKYYFYPALTGARVIYVLQKDMAVSPINLNQFEALVNNIDKKNSSSTANETIINDPFK